MRSSLGGTTILLIILAFLVMASGIGLIYYSAVYHPDQLYAQATATAQTVRTAQAQASGAANAQSTGTAQAFANATAQAMATTTALQNIYNQATSGAPILNDPLNGNNIYHWDVGNASLGGSCGFKAGAYHVIEPNKSYYLSCLAESTNFSNFAFQVQVTIIQGDEGGLIFRATGAKLYSFGFNREGLFSLIVSKNNNPGKPLIYGPNSAINTGLNQPNLLTVIARDSTFYLYINKQFVDAVRDSSYHSGQIGVYAAYSTHYTDVAFNDAQVWQV
jgi:hypothetical protein